jgi:nucleotide-binding universal stress UspA family protein
VAVRLARSTGARVSGLHVMPQGVPTAFSGGKLYGSGVIGPQYRRRARQEADRILAEVGREARSAGVPCETLRHLATDPWRAIVAAAQARRCDLIVMASHGRGSVKSLFLGSQTLKVLAHSRIPVLVCR